MRGARHGEFPHPLRRRPRGPGVRLAAAAALLVLAALGTAARQVTHLSTAGILVPGAQQILLIAGVAVVAAGCLVLAGIVVVLARRRYRREDDLAESENVIPLWARALAMLAAVALIALPIAAVVVIVRGRHGARPPAAPAPVLPVMPHLPAPAHPAGAAGTAVLVVVVLAVVALLVVTGLRLYHRGQAGAAAGYRPAAEPSPLAAAVAAGSTALGTTAGAREAIIACYAAMENTLAAAGSPRRVADTPEELLTRAEANGVIRTPAARRLTALFREARFSPHELADAQRHAASDALDDISHDLAGGP